MDLTSPAPLSITTLILKFGLGLIVSLMLSFIMSDMEIHCPIALNLPQFYQF